MYVFSIPNSNLHMKKRSESGLDLRTYRRRCNIFKFIFSRRHEAPFVDSRPRAHKRATEVEFFAKIETEQNLADESSPVLR